MIVSVLSHLSHYPFMIEAACTEDLHITEGIFAAITDDHPNGVKAEEISYRMNSFICYLHLMLC